MKKSFIISFFTAAVAGFISYYLKLSIVQVVRYALYDFLIVEILQIVMEVRNDLLSDVAKAMRSQQTKKLAEEMLNYSSKQHDNMFDVVVKYYIERLHAALKKSDIEGYETDLSFAIWASNEKSLNSISVLWDCKDIGFLSKINIPKCSQIILVYHDYAEVHQQENHFKEVLGTLDNLKFYRLKDDFQSPTYFIFDNSYVLELIKPNNTLILHSTSVITSHYLDSYRSYSQKATPYGLTPKQDSLFNDVAIADYYGVNSKAPNLHLEKIEPVSGMILDLGTGAGRLIQCFSKYDDCQIIAMDKDKAALERCESRYRDKKNIQFLNEEFTDHSFEENQFDIVVAYNSLYHTDRSTLQSYIQRVYQILKVGGYFLFTLKVLDGNEEIYEGAGEFNPIVPEHTYINTKFPDFQFPHHFCDNDEINHYLSMFSEVVYQENIKLIKHKGVIVQGKGKYYILKK